MLSPQLPLRLSALPPPQPEPCRHHRHLCRSRTRCRLHRLSRCSLSCRSLQGRVDCRPTAPSPLQASKRRTKPRSYCRLPSTPAAEKPIHRPVVTPSPWLPPKLQPSLMSMPSFCSKGHRRQTDPEAAAAATPGRRRMSRTRLKGQSAMNLYILVFFNALTVCRNRTLCAQDL